MRILISTDIEGVAGVFHAEQTRAGNGEYERARRWMTHEANAAVEGAFAGGATEVMVNDSAAFATCCRTNSIRAPVSCWASRAILAWWRGWRPVAMRSS